jgi:hypothetical protein
MADRIKEIEELRAKIAELEAAEAREAELRGAMESAHDALLAELEKNGVGFDEYVAHHAREYRRAVEKSEGGRGRRRTAASSTKSKVKIPAGSYTNIPSEPERVFEVKEKGPRPKAVREYAEEVGVDAFMARCRVA